MYSLIMVDDEIWTLRDMQMLLRDVEGFDLIGAYTSPLEARQAILQKKPDVVLTDLKMEELSGQQLMKAIHAHCPQTRIIICSAYRDFDAARDAIKYDVVDYLIKPIAKADFLRAFDTARALLAREKEKSFAFSCQRIAAADQPWTQSLIDRIKKEASCPCQIDPLEGAYALICYDHSENMAAYIQSMPKGLGFSREMPYGADREKQRCEALCSLCAGFAYTPHKPLDEVQSYIVLHYNEKLTLNRLAEKISFSSAYLCDLFRKKCGIQLFSFIKQVRIEMACYLLRTTNQPVQTVSLQVGYEDNSHFCREFKIMKGVTPNAYRRFAAQQGPTPRES